MFSKIVDQYKKIVRKKVSGGGINTQAEEVPNEILKSLERRISSFNYDGVVGEKAGDNEINELSFIVIEDLFSTSDLKKVLDALTSLCKIPTMVIASSGEILVESGGTCSSVCTLKNTARPMRSWETCYNEYLCNFKSDNCNADIFPCLAGFEYGLSDVVILGKTVGTLVMGPLKIANEATATREKHPTINMVTRNDFDGIYFGLKTVAEHLGTLSFQTIRLKEALTKGKAAEEARRENEKRYKILFQSADTAILILRASDYSILQCNEKAIEVFKCQRPRNLTGRNYFSFLPEKQPSGENSKSVLKGRFSQAISGAAQFFEVVQLRNDGKEFHAEVSAKKFELSTGCYLQVIIRDVSQRIEMELERQRLTHVIKTTEKMKAIGVLAGGIAHDFNNNLQAMQSNMFLITRALKDNENLIDKESLLNRIGEVEYCIAASAKLTSQVLGYARGGKYSEEVTKLDDLVEKALLIYRRSRKEIKVKSDYARDLWSVNIDRGQIEQVILNICLNASQAMPNGGDLVIRAQNLVIENQKYEFPTKPGKYVILSISDTGCGMTKDVMDQMFMPFYTTRRIGDGSGMGLSTAYGIVKNHGGYIYAESAIGVGTTFHVMLQATDEEVEEEILVADDVIEGTGTVLLVDDEEHVLNAAGILIESFGYTVIEAENGLQAIEEYEKNRQKIDVVIMDIVMPEMSGIETAKILKEKYPDILIIISTGYAEQKVTLADVKYDGFLKKPYKAQQLSIELDRVIAQRGQNAEADSEGEW